MNKHEICVHIKDDEMLQKAKELLEKHGETVNYELLNLEEDIIFNYLKFCNVGKDWFVWHKLEIETEITLDQLEGMLKN